MPSTTLRISQLRLSPHNVRSSIPDADDTAAIERSILVEGLRVPIDCHPMRGAKTWGAFAGRRRYFAIKRLVERGELPVDWPVPVIIHDKPDAELVEMSITENLLRKDMEEHELYAGVAMAAARGHSPEQISEALGQNDARKVTRWLRLGQLAKPIFEAFARGEIDQDQAKAYAGTDDRELQEATFKRLERWVRASEIRKALGIGDALARRHLSFVGEAIYRAAGGRYELDLFADAAEDRGRVADVGLLERLVEEKMAGIRDQVRVSTGQRDLRFVAAPPQTEFRQIDNQLAITPKRKGEMLELPEGDVVAHIEIDAGGEPAVSYWWASRKAKFGSEKAAVKPVSAGPIGNAVEDPHSARPKADAAIRREEGLSQDATFAMSAVRKAILKAALVDDAEAGGSVATDYFVFVQARCLLAERAPSGVGMRRIASDQMVGVSHEALDLGRRLVADMPATKTTAGAILRIKAQPFFTETDLAAAFIAYREADQVVKDTTAALVVGAALERSLAAPGYEHAIHDVLAHLVGADRDDAVRRRYWHPTSEVLDLFPKDPRRAIAEPFVDRATFTAWAKLKSSELTAAVVAALTRTAGPGSTWIPPLLRFRSGIVTSDEAADIQERAA
ncbi:ParB/RepB/Spo0J family partition protein [Sphingomonas sp. BK235]|uniref:ParB/RepB/Spo0J family partition protein n=1 Tax=Sphingomonas sp. BK235 TaxID=2512131 RepID=UPI0010CF33FB|nr:ParB/RepB/Spo0J family partition protein [Sphingomonas sp. BK235]TCP30729.1 ParB-like chromosome segregation protein Spo0J [Sphingomonas sp. BK235]